MFRPTNPDIDTGRLQEHVNDLAAYGRHAQPLALPPLLTTGAAASQPAGWRRVLRGVPLLGSSLVWARDRWWRMRSPGLSRAQRLRAVPVLGDLAAWSLAVLTLPRWRAQLRDQLTAQQAQIQELRQQQLRLQQELQRLRSGPVASARREPAPEQGRATEQKRGEGAG